MPNYGIWLRYAAPVAITAAALAAALTQVDIGSLLPVLRELRTSDLAIVVTALGAGALLASLRLQMIAHDLGYPLRTRDAIAALSLGQIAGSLFFQIVGQTAARGAFLARRGMPLAGTLVITGYERLAALLVSVVMAMVGAWILFGRITLDLERGGAELVKLAVGIALALLCGAAFAWGRDASQHLRRVAGPQATGRIVRVVAVSIVIQLSTMAAYMAAAKALAPEIGLGTMAAAAAVVMLAAALPISLAGWGIRELSAIYALGIIGLPKEKALVVAVVVGCAALVVVGVLALAALLVSHRSATTTAALPRAPIDYGALLGWSVPIAAATAVFFQIHVPLAQAPLNVNLADPVALVGAVLFAAAAIRAKRLPSWRLPGFYVHLALMMCVLALAFAHGWITHGWSGWAFTNRLVGWFVLLAYLATGALIVRAGGAAGLKLLTSTFAIVALAIIVIDAAIFIAVITGYQVPLEIIRYRSEGFAQNANAFALQLLLATAALLCQRPEAREKILPLALALLGLWLTGSKSALIGLTIVTAAALALGAVTIRRIVIAGAAAAITVLVINWLPEILFGLTRATQIAMDTVQGWFAAGGGVSSPPAVFVKRDFSALDVITAGYDTSSAERIASLKAAWQMFLDHPILGIGLGSFLKDYATASGAPLVIHSTPLWLATEAGIIGLAVFVAPFVHMLRSEMPLARRLDPAALFLVLALLGFGTMASVHDLLYQRPVWLLLGAALAVSRQNERA
jgi:O-antigen ligase